MGKLKRGMQELAYRMKLRKALQQSSREQLEITNKELHREINRRNKQ